MPRFGSVEELAAFLNKLDTDYAEHAAALWQKKVRTPQQLANASKSLLLSWGLIELHVDDIKARAGDTAAQEQALSSARQKQAGAVDTREQSDLTTELKKVIRALQDNMTLTQLVLRGQLRPVSSSASTKRLEDYRRRAIEYYYGSHADMSRIMCMVTGEEFDVKQITAGHIYRQGWGTGIVKAMGCRLHDPCNIILMQKQLEKRFDNWEWTVIPEESDIFRIHVLNPQLLDSKGVEQYITGHAGKGTKWRDINKTLLHLPPIARPARRICGLHAILAIQEADDKGWFDEHEAPEVTQASWDSPKFDGQLMSKFLGDSSTAGMFHTNDSEAD